MADNAPAKKLCFVISPIGAPASPERTHADWLLRGIIEPVFAEHYKDYRVERADKINAPGMIDSQVISRLLDAELVIADMSMLNANAFYEMGIRHMKQKPIIHMYRSGDKIPFDVAPYRAIAFSYSHPDDLEAAKAALKDSVDEVLKPGFQVENPVTRARGIEKLEEHATPEQKLVLQQLQSMESRLAAMERRESKGEDVYAPTSRRFHRVSFSSKKKISFSDESVMVAFLMRHSEGLPLQLEPTEKSRTFYVSNISRDFGTAIPAELSGFTLRVEPA